jgi:predicted extracellular nuclease
MKKFLFLISLCFISVLLYSQTEDVTVAFYNVENLFDTVDDPNIFDEDFTPEGKKKWTNEKYQKKLNDLAKVIGSIQENSTPDIVSFAEVENRQVLEDLIKTDNLLSSNYKIVHEDSPDARGIDVALIYNANHFEYIKHKSFPVPLNTKYKVRDILYVKGIFFKSDTFHLFVNHWKSRSGGQEQTEPQRIQCALTLKNTIDSIRNIESDAKILVMGDLNDTPKDKSVYETLQANNSFEKESLYNIMLPLSEEGFGTHNYRGEWSILDHIIVSNNLIKSTELFVKDKIGQIYSADWITYNHKNGNKSPNRTYGGPNYYGGYSDHYPVYVTIVKSNN